MRKLRIQDRRVWEPGNSVVSLQETTQEVASDQVDLVGKLGSGTWTFVIPHLQGIETWCP